MEVLKKSKMPNDMEFKVQIWREENDSYNELWKVVGEKDYFVRNTWGGGTWYFVCDPLGYCELDYACPDDYIFIVCDSNGNELLRDSNGMANRPKILSREVAAKQEWKSIEDNYFVTKEGLSSWLQSFMTPERITSDMTCPYDNWTVFWHEEKERRCIHEFTHLGDTLCIYQVLKKHKYCDAEWKEYYAGTPNMTEYENYIAYFGAEFDAQNHGPMYGMNEAICKVEAALKKIYAPANYISRVDVFEWGTYERKMKFYNTATLLLNGNYEREFVKSVIKKEQENPQFFRNRDEIKAKYPEYIPDYDTRIY